MSEPTIRLHNIDPAHSQLSLHLTRAIEKNSPRLRRGVLLTPIRIPAGRFYDVCLELNVDIEEARRIVRASPEVLAHSHARRLLVREFPPTEAEQAADAKAAEQAQDAEEKTAAANPPDSPDAVPPGVDLEAAGLALDTPRMTRPAAPAPAAEEAPAPEKAPETLQDLINDNTPVEGVFEDTPDDATDADAAADAAGGGDAVGGGDAAGAPAEPSMDWSTDDLRAFAAAKGIDVEHMTSKTSMLRKIRKGL